MSYCDKCGAYIPDEQVKCLACGYDKTAPSRTGHSAAGATAQAYSQAPRQKADTYDVPPKSPEPDIFGQTKEELKKEFELFRNHQREQSRRWAENEYARRQARRAWEDERRESRRSYEDFRRNYASYKSTPLALLLCLFAGYLGVHYFYVGRAGKGLLYLLTVGLFGIGWILDIIVIATGSFRDNAGAPLRW